MRMLMSAPMKPSYRAIPETRRRPRTTLVVSFLDKNSTFAAEQGGATLDSVAADQRQETTAEPAPLQRRRLRIRIAAVAPNLPVEIVVWEILVRLPAKDILGCRAVCSSWRDLTSTADFLLAHHRRQPSLPLLTLCGTARGLPILERCRPVLGFDNYVGFKIHTSCDGLLLLTLSDGRFSTCNPTTRLCAPLRGVTNKGQTNIVAMYLHRPSAEYRVLYWKGRHTDNLGAAYHILAVQRGCSSSWCIGLPLDSAAGIKKDTLALHEMAPTNYAPPILFRDCLHWDPCCLREDVSILVFDTVVESFRFMRRPAGATTFCARVCDMEASMGFSCFDDGRTRAAKIWLLEDYEREVWSLKYHVKFPAEALYSLPDTEHLVLSRNGDLLVYSDSEGYMFHCDNTGKLIEEFQCDSRSLSIIGHRLRESLVKHDFFPRQGSASARRQSLFRRL